MPARREDLLRAVGGRAEGACPARFLGLEAMAEAGAESLTFAAGRPDAETLAACRAGAVLIAETAWRALAAPARRLPPLILVQDARLAVAQALPLFAPPAPAAGVHPTAVVAPTALVHPTAHVGPLAVVEAGAELAAGAMVGAQSYVGAGARVGEGARLEVGARLLAGCVVGPEGIVGPGAVVGGSGFGYARDPASGRRLPMPNLGTVVLEARVEVGANSCIDRATFGTTRIGAGTKIDNLVQVGHNVQIGDDAVLVAQAGIAGSARLGREVVVGAQAGVADHRGVAEGVQLAARTGVAQDLTVPGGRYGGAPARPLRDWLREVVALKGLPALRQQLAAGAHAGGVAPPTRPASAATEGTALI